MANYTARANVASASAVTLPQGSNYVVVTGTTTITSLSARPSGEIVVLRFSGILTLTQNATSLILESGVDYLTVAGDKLTFISEGSGNWREIARQYNTAKVAFPATAVATTNVNTLDDYEEGTFTPGLQFGGAAVSMTFGTQLGQYTKIGNIVFITGRITLTAKGTSVGDALITALPFTVGNVSPVTLWPNVVTFASVFIGDVSATSINLREVTTGGVLTNLTDADFANTSDIIFSTMYRV